MKTLRRIHWPRYLQRKLLILAAVIVACYFVQRFTNNHLIGKGGEMLLSSVIEHTLFGVPMNE